VVFAQRDGARRAFVLNDREPYGFGVAGAFRAAAGRNGLRVVGTGTWDGRSANYHALADRVRRTEPDVVYLGGFLSSNGGRLIADLRRSLGPRARLIGPDGFAAPSEIVEAAGPAAEGFIWTIPVLPNDELPQAGRDLAGDFNERFGSRPCCYSVHAAQGMSMILDAISDSDGSRADVSKLLHAHVESGYLGDFEIDSHGDTTLNRMGVYLIQDGRMHFVTTITPSAALLARR
jgi:branched-chain amino acid transport system substrate-binding protein